MRFVLIALVLAAGPAHAWKAEPGPVCTLTHEEGPASVRLTYQPDGPLYTIAITRAEPWAQAPVFAIRFDGPAALTISTSRHQLSNNNRTVTVSDSGFGNVLNGLEFNRTATALLDQTMLGVSLGGAAPEVQKFRDCATAPIT